MAVTNIFYWKVSPHNSNLALDWVMQPSSTRTTKQKSSGYFGIWRDTLHRMPRLEDDPAPHTRTPHHFLCSGRREGSRDRGGLRAFYTRRASLLTFSHQTPQLYFEFPVPTRELLQTLKGFTNVALRPGHTQQVKISDLFRWDVVD